MSVQQPVFKCAQTIMKVLGGKKTHLLSRKDQTGRTIQKGLIQEGSPHPADKVG